MSITLTPSTANRIERDDGVRFHPSGTLIAVTRWITSDDEGIAEWLKNSRRMYQVDRANVPEEHRVVAMLLRDAHGREASRIGVLDVGGASAADLERWSVWQDPNASTPNVATDEEQTQGNGGKAYMYRQFTGPARLLGVANGLRNSKGFVGLANSSDRGIAGWIPSRAEGRDAPAGPWKVELNEALAPYGVSFETLPTAMRNALEARQSFTLVEGEDSTRAYHGRIDAESILERLVRHEQSTLALEQMRVYVIHNGRLLENGKPLHLDEIPAYEGFATPRVIPIPETLPYGGHLFSTTADGVKEQGRLILRTSKANLAATKKHKARWKISYRAGAQMVGAKPVAELAPTTPGSNHVYGTVELLALQPDYVSHGRVRPNDGPLMEALDEFVGDQIRLLARELADRQRQDLNERALDEVAEENRVLDRWKDQFLPPDVEGGDAGSGNGMGEKPRKGKRNKTGIAPHIVELAAAASGYVTGVDVTLNLSQLLSPTVRDEFGNAISGVRLVYRCDDESILRVDRASGRAVGVSKGTCSVYVQVDPSGLSSTLVPFRIVVVDHVLLTPRQIELPIGGRKQIVAEVTTEDGQRSSDVLLNWRHDAEDPLVVRIRPTGIVTGNREGVTRIYAGAGDVVSGVWSRVPAIVSVVAKQQSRGRGEGHPQLKLTGRDIDPETNEIREGDPEQPALWQEPIDVANNIWWLNVAAPEAALAFKQRDARPDLWRLLHASKLVDMVCQVHMQTEYNAAGESERLEPWAMHKQALERYQVSIGPAMWERLTGYVVKGEVVDT